MTIRFKVGVDTLQAFCNDDDYRTTLPFHVWGDVMVLKDILKHNIDDVQSITVGLELFQYVMEWKEQGNEISE